MNAVFLRNQGIPAPKSGSRSLCFGNEQNMNILHVLQAEAFNPKRILVQGIVSVRFLN